MFQDDRPKILGAPPFRFRFRSALRPLLGALLSLAAGFGALVGYGYMQYGAISTLLDDADAWSEGEVAIDGLIEGEVTTRQLILDSYDLNVEWVDQRHGTHSSDVRFDTLFDSVEDDEPVEVRYLLRDGELLVATSWGESVRVSRWVAVIFMLVVGVLIGLVFVWLGLSLLGSVYRDIRCARDCEEVVLRVVSIAKRTNNGVVTDIYTLRDDQAEQDLYPPGFKRGQRPLFVGVDGTHVLAIRSKKHPGHVIFLDDDMKPLAFDHATRADILTRAQNHKLS